MLLGKVLRYTDECCNHFRWWHITPCGFSLTKIWKTVSANKRIACIDFPKYINGALYIMLFRCRKYFPSIEYAIANECQKAPSSKIFLMTLRKHPIFSYLNKYGYAKTARRYYLLGCKYAQVGLIWKENRYLYQAIQSRYSSFASTLSRKVTVHRDHQ